MDSIKIYSASGALLVDAILEDSSTQDWGIMSENQVALEFYTDECVILPASCYIEFEGQRFWLLEEYKPTENNSAEWAYQVRFLGAESLLSVTVVMNTTDNLDEPIFNLTAPASQHLDFIVKNLNRRFPEMNWRVGVVPETENIHIEYVGTYASDALQTIVGEKYEWWVDDYVVNVGRCEFGTTIELGYGKGLIGDITYSTANEMRSYAYLYPIGSTRNIDPAKYGHARLQLPNGQTRIDINPEQGLSELVEADAFASIFPRYVGKVTSVRTSTGENSDGTTFLIYHIKDTAIPFNPNDYEIAGEVKHITFQSGELMGADFEVNYDANNKEFEIITQFLDEGLSQLPGGTLIPKTGDKYVVWNISMPDEYYPLAEQEFLQAALSFVQDSIKETSVYRAPVDFIDLQERGLTLRPGQKVRLLSDEYFPQNGYYDSRITRIIRDICYPDELIIEVSSVVTQGTISRLRTSVSDSATKVASLGQSLKNYVDVMSPQSVRGVKNFVNGLSIGGVGLWRHPDGYVYLDETLVLKGGVVMFGNGSDVEVPSIFDSLPIDGRTIKRDGNGALYVDETALSVSGGGGVADSVYWNNVIGKPSWIGSTKPTYKYSEIEESPDLSVYALASSLANYALASAIPTNNNQLTNGAGYITANALTPYFLASNFNQVNIKSTLGISDWALASAKPTYTASEVGALGVNGTAADANKLGGYLSTTYLRASGQYTDSLNDLTSLGIYRMSGTIKDGPADAKGYGNLMVVRSNSWDTLSQIYFNSSNNRMFVRSGSNNSYTTRSWDTLAFTSDIPTKLSQLTDDVVAGKYLLLSGDAMKGSVTTRTDVYSWGTAKTNGHIIAGHTPSAGFAPIISTGLQSGGYGKLGQVGDIFGLYAYSSEGTSPSVRIELMPEDGNVRIYGHINPYTTNSYNLGNSNAKWGNIYATSFIGNLTGNADSATDASNLTQTTYTGDVNSDDLYGSKSRVLKLSTNANLPTGMTYGNILYIGGGDTGFMLAGSYSRDKLLFRRGTNRHNAAQNIHTNSWKEIAFTDSNVASATKLATARTIWGQSFDGTGNISGAMTVDGDATFSSKVIVGTIPVYQSADGTLFVDANVVFRGGVAMYGDTTTTINEE